MKKFHLLLVEDDPALSFVMKDNLEMNGYQVSHASSGGTVNKLLAAHPPDLCLLDVMLPELDGFSIARNIRSSNPDVPILFITARSLQEDKLKAFSLGADDYITKPFSMEELLYRIAVFLRRSNATAAEPDQVEATEQLAIGKYLLDTGRLHLCFEGQETKLTRRESDLLQLLARKRNQVVKREEILKKLWGDDDYFAGRSLDVFVSRLRKYLKEDPEVQIENHHSVGFQLRAK